MFKFFHQMMNPHCPDCKQEREDSRICNSCETLKYEIERLTSENQLLLNKVLSNPVETPIQTERSEVKPILPRNIPWNVRRQMLEAEDRQKARLMKQAPQPDTTEDLEKELGIVERTRENATTK